MLNSVTKIYAQLSIDVEPRSPFSACSHHKIALIVVEIRDVLPQKKGQLSAKVRIVLILASIDENPFLFGMGVQISKHEDLFNLVRLEYSLPCPINLRMSGLISTMPNTIQVVARQATAI